MSSNYYLIVALSNAILSPNFSCLKFSPAIVFRNEEKSTVVRKHFNDERGSGQCKYFEFSSPIIRNPFRV